MSCLERIRIAGVVGCGGAGFPTAVKLAGEPKHLIINGVECEPLLGTDRYVMRHFANRLVAALDAIAAETGANESTFVLKESYGAEIASLTQAIAEAGSTVRIHTVTSFYPAGDEQAVVYEVTGKTVPPMNIPLSAGCAVINVSTLLACADALEDRPFTHRFLTVAGEVAKPCVIYAPIGTPFAECIELAGGITMPQHELCLVSGGPMMGKRYEYGELDALFVEKTTSGILLLPAAKYRSRPLALSRIRQLARASCIQCTQCTDLCPRYLQGHPLEPHKIMRKLAFNELADVMEDPVIRSAALCCECGVCEIYACPMQLQPREVNSLIKKELARQGIRHPKSDEPTLPLAMRKYRKVPSERIAARVGVLAYYHQEIGELNKAAPEAVCIALKQGIGAPSLPMVAEGDIVQVNQLIAQCPEGSLGANAYAPIAGRVTLEDGCIRIER